MQARRDAALLQRQRGLDHASRAGGNHQVADVALGRTDAPEAGVRSLPSQRLRQSFDLDRIAQRPGVAVFLEVTDAPRIDTSVIQRHPPQFRMSFHARRREPGLVGTIFFDLYTSYPTGELSPPPNQ